MNFRVALACVMVFFFSAVLPSVQADDPPGKWSPLTTYRALTWDDFPVNDTAPGLSAQTRTFMRYSLRAVVDSRHDHYTARAESLQFTGGMDRAGSWRRSSVPSDAVQLLRHEQGHLAINELRRRALQRRSLSDFPVGQGGTQRAAYDDLVSRLRQWYRKELEDLTAEQNRYDKETSFGTRSNAQADWSARLDEALRKP